MHSEQAFDVIIYGDSITEAFRGTTQGRSDPLWDENRYWFQQLIGSQYRAAVYSIAGKCNTGAARLCSPPPTLFPGHQC